MTDDPMFLKFSIKPVEGDDDAINALIEVGYTLAALSEGKEVSIADIQSARDLHSFAMRRLLKHDIEDKKDGDDT